MAESAEDFLKSWRQTRIYSEGRGLESLDDSVNECIKDAVAAGVVREDLENAAGGNLRGFIRQAILDKGSE
jgi:hypothetical protein